MTSPPIFSNKQKGEDYEIRLELATIATDMRTLGFNEETIKRWISRIWTYDEIVSIRNMIYRYKQQADLYGDAQE